MAARTKAAALVALLAVSLLAVELAAGQVSTTNLYPEVYSDLLAPPCTRLLNASGTIGCSSQSVRGVLYSVVSQSEFDDFLNNGALKAKYILVAPLELLNRENLDRAQTKVAGWVAVEGNPRGNVSSFDATCPDCSHPLVRGYDWNPKGTGLMYNNFNIPIFAALNGSQDLSKALTGINNAVAYNKARSLNTPPLLVAEMESAMNAIKDSSNCLRRGMCKPLGGLSVYSAFTNTFSRNIVFLTATMDAASFFHDFSQGATASVTGVAALLAAAQGLAKVDRSAFKRDLAFAVFNGERWGHIGSRAFVKDIAGFTCAQPFTGSTSACPYIRGSCSSPCVFDTSFTAIKLSQVSHVLDANVMDAGRLTFHSNNQGLTGALSSLGLSANTRGFPPSPAFAFVDKNPGIAAAALSTLNDVFPAAYGTEYDDGKLALTDSVVNNVCNASAVLARAALTLALDNGASAPSVNVDCGQVRSLLTCALTAQGCPLDLVFQSNARPTMYTGVATWGARANWVGDIASVVLANATGTVRDPTKDCRSAGAGVCAQPSGPTANDGERCLAGRCVASFTHMHLGYPDGLAFDAKAELWTVADPAKTTWVESDWDRTTFRIFYEAPIGVQVAELLVGIAVVCASAALGFIARKRIKAD